MQLMKSAFGSRYMIIRRWGTSLFLEEPAWRRPADPLEIQIVEYRSWSRVLGTAHHLSSPIHFPITRCPVNFLLSIF
jgi:hypothetical protein